MIKSYISLLPYRTVRTLHETHLNLADMPKGEHCFFLGKSAVNGESELHPYVTVFLMAFSVSCSVPDVASGDLFYMI